MGGSPFQEDVLVSPFQEGCGCVSIPGRVCSVYFVQGGGGATPTT